ncbi:MULTISPECIES: adenosylcobinamide amidohydrolase [Paenibacillus]|uniref:adenosylcobinamide amidohydrolase n=1 Tax=Paenibacillus TaxID=44249 RepID=UPI0022B8F504|nr:adenosylcobinamide amidohydrolase [Paenibacillus caseinilyticus]MCZ8517980.1 adenosylcobinamide amidohydrolase [Paenibacillus caseinilyticus]
MRRATYSTLPIEGLSSSFVDNGYESLLTIEGEAPLRVLNSSMWGEGFTTARRLINRQVSKHYLAEDPLQEMRSYLEGLGTPWEETAALLTAADLRDRGYRHAELGLGGGVCSWVTAGLSNRIRGGRECDESLLYPGNPGTINIIVVIDGYLTDAAFVNAVITATEAKTAALQDLDVRLEDCGLTATGTSTDAVMIASLQQGERHRYAGISTNLGYAISRTVYEAAVESAARCLNRGDRMVKE